MALMACHKRVQRFFVKLKSNAFIAYGTVTRAYLSMENLKVWAFFPTRQDRYVQVLNTLKERSKTH